MTDTQLGLSGTQKVAVVLMNMNQARASEVLKQFSDTEAEEIVAEIVRMKRVDAVVAERAMSEFHELATRGATNARGGKEIAAGLLEASFGAERAAGLMSRVTSHMAGKAFEFIEAAEPGQIVTLLDGELPQTVALVLAHLRPEQASAILSGFDEDIRTEVAHCIATMSSATPEGVRVVAETLRARAGAVVATRETLEVVGGVQPLVDIINRSSVATEKALLEALDDRDPDLAEEVRSRMLTFADIVKLERKDVQQVLRGIDAAVLAVAMKGSGDIVSATIRENLSERNREILDDETAALGPVRLSQVEEARAQIVRTIRDLESDGVITVQRAEEELYVS